VNPLVRPAKAGKTDAHDGENPFWISYADLMTALMVLFLVALTVALFAVTQTTAEVQEQKAERQEEIADFMAQLKQLTANYPGITVRGSTIDFGERARFASNSHQLNTEQIRLLREFVPEVLRLARNPIAARWLKRITVIGYADPRGSYLYNLNLSLQRSSRVLCTLLTPMPEIAALPEIDRMQVRQLFIVSGASFNAQKTSLEASRRIELRLEFFEAEEPPDPAAASIDLASTRQDDETQCPLDSR
jgi:outer membrane protein OmpA-like peptidoglycan-associated protein